MVPHMSLHLLHMLYSRVGTALGLDIPVNLLVLGDVAALLQAPLKFHRDGSDGCIIAPFEPALHRGDNLATTNNSLAQRVVLYE